MTLQIRGILAGLVIAGTALIASGHAAKAQLLNGTFDAAFPLQNWSSTPGVLSAGSGSHTPQNSVIFSTPAATLFQSFNLPAAGQYILSFFFRAVPSATSLRNNTTPDIASITASIAGVTFSSLAFGTGYSQSFSTVLDLSQTNNLLQFFDGAANNNGNVQLDTIQFTQVDVPGPLAGAGLASLAAGGLLLMRRRRLVPAQA